MVKLLIAVGAENGGALSNLEEFYNKAFKTSAYNNDNWVFVISATNFKKEVNDRIKIEYYSYVKRSWIHRLFFNIKTYKSIIKKYKPQEVHNFDIFFDKKRKKRNYKVYYYCTNSLFYSNVKFSFFESPTLWIRQKMLSKLEFQAVKNSDVLITECLWMKEAVSKKTKKSIYQIEVVEHNYERPSNSYSQTEERTVFFYPASAFVYKNHSIIIDALKKLNNRKGISIVFTLSGNENARIIKLKKRCIRDELPIEWLGLMEKKEVYKYYEHSTLIFPSYLETIGLPLIEAKSIGCPIICSDLPYAHNSLKDYSNVSYFPYNDAEALAEAMKVEIDKNEGSSSI